MMFSPKEFLLKLGKHKLVDFGIVKKTILKDFNIKQEVLFADFNWQRVMEVVSNKTIKVKDLAKFPMVKRDLALLLNDDVTFGELYIKAFQTEKQLLKTVELFDVYQGDKLAEGKKSYAISFQLQDNNKTLNDKQIDKVMQKLQHTFERDFKAELR